MMQDIFPVPSSNGNGTLPVALAPPAPVSRYTPDQIIKMVDQHETDMRPLRDRMEADYGRYRIERHQLRDVVTGNPLKNYAVYTSSAPRAFANKIISWLTQADVLLRVKHTNDKEHDKTVDNLKENLAVGLLNAADERLIRTLSPKLQAALAFQLTVLGGIIGGRCLLAKRPDGSTYVDITPFDPQNTHFGVGYDGLEWACHKLKKTRQQIQNEYGVSIQQGPPLKDGSTDAEKDGIYIYDFYDARINTIVTGKGEMLKPPTPHGASRVPCYMVLVGNVPLRQAMNLTDSVKDLGESVYESARGIYDKWNDIMSIMLELTARARRQGWKVFSADGKKVLPEDPSEEGTELSLQMGKEDVLPLGMLEMQKNTGEFLAQISGELQRATLPHSAYGELPFQLSGYAINALRQGIETVLTPRVEAMQAIYLQIANLLYDQYRSGNFSPMELSGVSQGRKYFSQTITPEELEGSCNYTVKVVSQLPQDDMTKYTMAGLARTGPNPLFSDDWIRDNILMIQDSEEAASQVKAQMSEHALPEAGIYSLMVAAQEQNRPDLAAFYYQALVQLLAAKMGVLPPGQATGAPGETTGQSKPPGVSPQVMPQAAMGTPPSPLTSNNATSRVAPGTPRAPRPSPGG